MIEHLQRPYSQYEQMLEKERDTLEPYFAAPVPSAFGDTVRADTLMLRFAVSPYGQHMHAQPLRFLKYEYDRELMLEHLREDVDPLLHQINTGMYVARILHAEHEAGNNLKISQEEIGIIMLAAWIHDMGEATHDSIAAEVGEDRIVGDIPFGQKTDENRENEAAVRIALYRRVFPDVSIEALKRIEEIISHKDDTILHDLFEAAHTLQSNDTGYEAQEIYYRDTEFLFTAAATTGLSHFINPDANMAHLHQLPKLHNDVKNSTTHELIRFAKQFTFVREVAVNKFGFDIPQSATTR